MTDANKPIVSIENESKAVNIPGRARVGMEFQHFNLFQHKTALENVTLPQIVVLKRSRQRNSTIENRRRGVGTAEFLRTRVGAITTCSPGRFNHWAMED